MCLSKLVELSEKKMAETQTELKDVESKLVGTDDMPPTSTRIVETQTEEFEMVVKPTVVETKEIDTISNKKVAVKKTQFGEFLPRMIDANLNV